MKDLYLFKYADDPHPSKGWVLREGTMDKLVLDPLNRIHYYKNINVLHLPTDTILAVYKKTLDHAGNIIWVEQDLAEFYQRCVEYIKKKRNKNAISSNDYEDKQEVK